MSLRFHVSVSARETSRLPSMHSLVAFFALLNHNAMTSITARVLYLVPMKLDRNNFIFILTQLQVKFILSFHYEWRSTISGVAVTLASTEIINT